MQEGRQFVGGMGYRWGFGGQESVEEVVGTSNHIAFSDYGYDCRLSRRWNLDPYNYNLAFLSAYATLSNSPLFKLDPDGKWDIYVHAYADRKKSGYALIIVKDNKGNEVYRTVVGTLGVGGSNRSATFANTPQGKYKILEWRKTNNKRYPRISYGPNDLLALRYEGGEGGNRQDMHLHGGRQEGAYQSRRDLAKTQGCQRINDEDIRELKQVTDRLEENDPTESKGYLTLQDDLVNPVIYDANRHEAGLEQFPRSEAANSNRTTTSNSILDGNRIRLPAQRFHEADNLRIKKPINPIVTPSSSAQ
jgi:hypothetical protein